MFSFYNFNGKISTQLSCSKLSESLTTHQFSKSISISKIILAGQNLFFAIDIFRIQLSQYIPKTISDA